MTTFNFSEMKNDTARRSAIRETLANIIFLAMVAEFGEDNVVLIPFKITVNDTDIPGGTVAICTGQTTNKDNAVVDIVATVSPTVRAFNTTTNKANRTTYAINFYDIVTAIEEEREARKEKEEEKAKAKEEKIAKDKKEREEKKKKNEE